MDGVERLALDPEELLDRALGLRVAALADMDVGEVAGPVEEVARRPALVVVGAPELEARVQRTGCSMSRRGDRGADAASSPRTAGSRGSARETTRSPCSA
jgi:hypothetical protein